jgi:HEAT repeat protein
MSAHRIRCVLAGSALGVGVLLAVWALTRHAPTVSLQDPNPAVRVAAIRAMGTPGDAELLIAALRDEDADVRLVAAQHLGGSGPQAEQRAAALGEALKDRRAGVRREAAESLWSLGPVSSPVLLRGLTDPDPQVRAWSAFALGHGGRAKEDRSRPPGEVTAASPLLAGLLNDEDPEVRRRAAEALDVMERAPREVAP